MSSAGISIHIQGIHKSYGSRHVLRGVNLEITPGETLAIIGGSGEGKSALIRQIIGLEDPDSGEVRLGHLPVPEYRSIPADKKPFRVSMVFQSSALLNSLSVANNVGLALREHRIVTEDEINLIVERALDQVDMAGTGTKMPSELSGGMRKRVAIARALALEAQVILYDEPTAELDPVLTREVALLIRRIQEQRAATQIVVTHDLPLASEIADHVAMLHDGKIVDYRAGADFFQSDHPQTRSFLRAARLG